MTPEERNIAENDLVWDFVDELAAIEAAEARLHAQRVELLARAMSLADTQKARIASTDSAQRDMPLRSIAAQLGVGIRVNDRTIQHQMNDAVQLTTLFPETVAALKRGEISRSHAAVMLDTGACLDDPEVRAAFEQVVLERAQTLTSGRLKAFARQLAEKLHPQSVTERYEEACADRRIYVVEQDDGMAQLVALLPATLAYAIMDRLTQQGKAVRSAANATPSAGESDAAGSGELPIPAASDGASAGAEAEPQVVDRRGLDQVRADLLADMLLTGAPSIDPTLDRRSGGLGAIRAKVQVTVPVTTAAGASDRGALLNGQIPIDADTARRLVGAASGFDRVMTHPITGMVLAVDRYTPAAEQDRFVDARDTHCRFPGCRMPAHRCDHDHTHDYAKGGKTEITNLACLCKRHHTLKGATDWTVTQDANGNLEWTTPAGRTYIDAPAPRVQFVPDSESAPF
ncbi:DUF222 domain-containing protein [Microbacterium sp. P05]|uniref:HNH endonuclease signature motif containing protein n=1 Tax=Microbacterium sp. P05 TaxID=3366948 RepID=UPI00374704CF